MDLSLDFYSGYKVAMLTSDDARGGYSCMYIFGAELCSAINTAKVTNCMSHLIILNFYLYIQVPIGQRVGTIAAYTLLSTGKYVTARNRTQCGF
jgi:hypothetical protein